MQWLKADAGLAAAILRNTHPTGRSPSVRSIDVEPRTKASARVFVTVDWKGGVLGGTHSTRIAWEFSAHCHIATTLAGDNADASVLPEHRKKLDAYFRDEVLRP